MNERPRGLLTRAALLSGASGSIGRLFGAALSIVVARLVGPSDLGVLGIAVTVIGVLTMATHCAESAGVSSRSKGSDLQYGLAAALLRVGLTASLLGFTLLALPRVAAMVAGRDGRDSELARLVGVLALTSGFEALACFPRVILQRRLELTYLVLANTALTLSHLAFSLTALWLGLGIEGLTWASVGAYGLHCVVVWLRLFPLQPWSRDRWFAADVWRQVIQSGTSILVGSFGGYLSGRLDNLLVAAVLGPKAMAFYSMAWTASRLLPSVASEATGFVLLPTISRASESVKEVQKLVDMSIRQTGLVLALACALVAATAASAVQLLLGTAWSPVVVPLRLMCAAAVAAPALQALGTVLLGLGRAHMTAVATSAQLVFLVAVLPSAARLWGLLGAAVVDFLAVMTLLTILAITVTRVTPIDAWGAIGALRLPCVASAVAFCIGWAVGAALQPGVPRLLAEAVATLACYLLALTMLGGRALLAEFVGLVRVAVLRIQPAAKGLAAERPEG